MAPFARGPPRSPAFSVSTQRRPDGLTTANSAGVCEGPSRPMQPRVSYVQRRRLVMHGFPSCVTREVIVQAVNDRRSIHLYRRLPCNEEVSSSDTIKTLRWKSSSFHPFLLPPSQAVLSVFDVVAVIVAFEPRGFLPSFPLAIWLRSRAESKEESSETRRTEGNAAAKSPSGILR